jgi:hypothetical protein
MKTIITQDEATSAIVAAWHNHAAQTKQVTAKLASDLAPLPPGTPVESSEKIARKYGVSPTMATNARCLLMGVNLIHKAGRHYFTGPPYL